MSGEWSDPDAYVFRTPEGGRSLSGQVSKIEVRAEVPEDGYYRLVIRYAAVRGYKRNHILIDGDVYGEFVTPANEGFVDGEAGIIQLNKGTHRITVAKSWGEIDIDAFKLYPTSEPAPLDASFALVNPNAARECKALMNYFKDIYGNKIVTGQHTAAATGPEFDFIQEKTGKLPALRGFDLLSYSLGTETENQSEHKLLETEENKGSIEAAIDWYVKKGGIVTLCWHWYAPTGGNDKTFYTKNTSFDLRTALIPGTVEYIALLADMDEIAKHLKRMQDAGVPVLWRPLHEADGKWFWWGAQGAEPYKQLWKWMFDRYTNHHQLNNLIWVWNAPDPEWYPGDEFVDIAGNDIYAAKGNYGPLKIAFDYTSALAANAKPVALTENGPIPDPDKLMESRAAWLWFMPWYGGFVFEEDSTSFEQLRKVYEHPYCVTLQDLPELKSYKL